MIVQIYNGDMEQLGLFEVKEYNPQISKEDAEAKIIDAFIEAQQKIDGHDDDLCLIDKADEILMEKTNGQISRVFVEEIVLSI